MKITIRRLIFWLYLTYTPSILIYDWLFDNLEDAEFQ